MMLESNCSSIKEDKPQELPLIYCQICKVREKQYKCPRCGYFTCSLICCKKHKEELNCNGERDRTAFVPYRDLKSENIRSDYHFLENVLQSKDSAKRILTEDFGGQHVSKKPKQEVTSLLQDSGQNLNVFGPKIKNLVNAAKERGTKLVIMPQGMTKRVNNKTSLKKNIITWKVNIIFIMTDKYSISDLFKPDLDSMASLNQLYIASDNIISITLDSVNENKLLSEILSDYFDSKQGNSIDRQILKPLRIHREEVECMIQRIPSPANNPLFAKVMTDCSLKQALYGQTVIEYPTLYFGWSQNLKKLRTLVSDTIDSNVTSTLTSNSVVPLVDYQSDNEENKTSEQHVIHDSLHKILPSNVSNEIEDGEIKESDGDNENMEEVEDGDIDDDVQEEEFLRTLKEMENADINTLKEIIAKLDQE